MNREEKNRFQFRAFNKKTRIQFYKRVGASP